MTTTVRLPTGFFPDPDQGRPVALGKVYIGVIDLDPTVEANRINVTIVEEDGSETVIPPASQPFSLNAGGVFTYNGSPVQLRVSGDYSMTVLDANDVQQYYFPEANARGENVYDAEYAYTDGASQSLAAASTGFSAGATVRTIHFDSNKTLRSGAVFQATGSTTAGKAGNCPDADGYFYDADGVQFEPEIKHLRFFGGVPDDSTDNTAAVTAWIAAGQATGDTLYQSAGDYRKDPHDITLTANLEFRADKNARFAYIAASASDTPMFIFRGDSRTYGVSWYRGILDNRDGVFTVADQSNTCIALKETKNSYFENIFFRGQDTRAEAVTPTTGTDSGITTEGGCISTKVHACYFLGQGDAGVYLNGSNSNTVDFDTNGGADSVTECFFSECQQALTTKRSANGLAFCENSVYRCYLGVSAFRTGSNTLLPGRNIVVDGNFFKFIETRAAEFQSGYGNKFVNNTVEDFGIQLSDGTTESSLPYGVRGLGSQNLIVENNTIQMKEWTKTGGQQGVNLNDVTIDSVDYDAVNTMVYKNTFNDLDKGVVEADADQGPTYVEDNFFPDTTTPVTFLNGASVYKRPVSGWSESVVADATNTGTGEDDLHSVTLPAGALDFDGGIVEFEMWGGTSGSADSKTLKVYLGATEMFSISLTTSQSNRWHCSGIIGAVDQSGTLNQKYNVRLIESNTSGGGTVITAVQGATATETASDALVIKSTGEATSDADITQNYTFVKVQK